MQIEKENRLSVPGSIFVANVFCGMRALWDGKFAIGNSVWETTWGRNENCLLEMLLKNGAGVGRVELLLKLSLRK